MANPSSWMVVSSATAVYPSDGLGGTTATAGSSNLIGKSVAIDALLILTADASASTVTIMKQDGTTALVTIPVAAAASQVLPQYTRLGVDGMRWNGGISVKTSSTNTTGILYYRGLY